MKNKAVIAFHSVEIDMDNCADCTKRDRRSLTKLYNQANVQGTRVCGINYCHFISANKERKFVYCLFVVYPRGAERFVALFVFKTKKQVNNFVHLFHISLVLQFLQPVLHVHPDAVLRLDGTYPMF